MFPFLVFFFILAVLSVAYSFISKREILYKIGSSILMILCGLGLLVSWDSYTASESPEPPPPVEECYIELDSEPEEPDTEPEELEPDFCLEYILVGTWSGEFTANQGITSLDLIITSYANDIIYARFYFSAHHNNPNIPSGSYTMRGSISDNMLISLVGQEWIEQPADFNFLNIIGTLDIDNKVISSEEASLLIRKVSRDITLPNGDDDDNITRPVSIRNINSYEHNFSDSDVNRDNRYNPHTDVVQFRSAGFRRDYYSFVTSLRGQYARIKGTLFVEHGETRDDYTRIRFEIDGEIIETHRMNRYSDSIPIDIDLTGGNRFSISMIGSLGPRVYFAYFRLYPHESPNAMPIISRPQTIRDIRSIEHFLVDTDVAIDREQNEQTDVVHFRSAGFRRDSYSFVTLLNNQYIRIRGVLFVEYGETRDDYTEIRFERLGMEPVVHELNRYTSSIPIDIDLSDVDRFSISMIGSSGPRVFFAYLRLYPYDYQGMNNN